MPMTSQRPSPEVSPRRPRNRLPYLVELCPDRNSDLDSSQETQPPTPAPEDLAAKFDAHDMMAYYGDPADETPHQTFKDNNWRIRLTAPESSFLARSQPPMRRRRGASFGDPITKVNATEAHPGRGFTRWFPSDDGSPAATAETDETTETVRRDETREQEGSPPRQGASLLHNELASQEKH